MTFQVRQHALRYLTAFCSVVFAADCHVIGGADQLMQIPPATRSVRRSDKPATDTWSQALLREPTHRNSRSVRSGKARPALIPSADPPPARIRSPQRTRTISLPAADAESEGAPLPQEPTSGFMSEGLQSDVTLQIQRRHRERTSLFRQLQQQLEVLKERLATPPPLAEPPMTVQTTEPDESPQPVAETDVAEEVEPETTDAADVAATEPPPTIEPKPSSVFSDSEAAQALVQGPVDRVGLADNLYALEELQIALEMYKQVELKELPAAERYWVTYQTASCLRRLKQIPEAQETYRRLAGRNDAGWLAKMSTWWLHRMDARKELELSLKNQQKVLDALAEVYDESSLD